MVAGAEAEQRLRLALQRGAHQFAARAVFYREISARAYQPVAYGLATVTVEVPWLAGLVIVALPEEMVVNETIELWEKLHHEVPELPRPTVVLNRAAQPSLSPDERTLIGRLSAQSLSPTAAELLLSGQWEADLEGATAEAISRLGAEVGPGLLVFPRLGSLGGFEGGPEKVVRQLAAALQRQALAERTP
jgi:hypothetical protein